MNSGRHSVTQKKVQLISESFESGLSSKKALRTWCRSSRRRGFETTWSCAVVKKSENSRIHPKISNPNRTVMHVSWKFVNFLCSFRNHLHRRGVIQIDLEHDPVVLDSIILQFHLDSVRISWWDWKMDSWFSKPNLKISKKVIFISGATWIHHRHNRQQWGSRVQWDPFRQFSWAFRTATRSWRMVSFLPLHLVPAVRIFDTVWTSQINHKN